MTDSSGSIRGDAARGQPNEVWNARRAISANKPLSIGVLALLLVMIIAFAVGLLGAGTTKVSDATLCSGWSSTTPAQQQAYGRLYLREHGSVPGGPGSVSAVVAAANFGCLQAFSNGVDETVNVVQAIKDQ